MVLYIYHCIKIILDVYKKMIHLILSPKTIQMKVLLHLIVGASKLTSGRLLRAQSSFVCQFCFNSNWFILLFITKILFDTQKSLQFSKNIFKISIFNLVHLVFTLLFEQRNKKIHKKTINFKKEKPKEIYILLIPH